MSWIGYSWLLLHNLGVPETAWPNILLPLGGQLPTNEANYLRLLHLLRQNEHDRHGWKKDGMQPFAQEESSFDPSASDDGWGMNAGGTSWPHFGTDGGEELQVPRRS